MVCPTLTLTTKTPALTLTYTQANHLSVLSRKAYFINHCGLDQVWTPIQSSSTPFPPLFPALHPGSEPHPPLPRPPLPRLQAIARNISRIVFLEHKCVWIHYPLECLWLYLKLDAKYSRHACHPRTLEAEAGGLPGLGG